MKALPPIAPLRDVVALEPIQVRVGDSFVVLHVYEPLRCVLRAQVLVNGRSCRFWREAQLGSVAVTKAAAMKRLKVSRL